jgi:hypothetical protein
MFIPICALYSLCVTWPGAFLALYERRLTNLFDGLSQKLSVTPSVGRKVIQLVIDGHRLQNMRYEPMRSHVAFLVQGECRLHTAQGIVVVVIRYRRKPPILLCLILNILTLPTNLILIIPKSPRALNSSRRLDHENHFIPKRKAPKHHFRKGDTEQTSTNGCPRSSASF